MKEPPHVADILEPDLAAKLLVSILRGMVLEGRLEVRGKTPAQIATDFTRKISENLDHQEFQLVVDHTTSLFSRAKKCEKKGDLEIAVVFYATWAEHQINQILAILLQRRGYDDDCVYTIIRETGFRGKIVWIYVLMRRKPNKAVTDSLIELQEVRNSFIHYKWRPTEKRSEKLLRTIERAKKGLGISMSYFLSGCFWVLIGSCGKSRS